MKRADIDLAPHDLWRDRLAAEFDAMSRELEAMGGRLCTDIAVVRGHMEALQAIDHLAQRAQYSARLLRMPDIEQGIAECPLAEMAERLRTAA
ncbi:MAG: hypothetical protein WC803_11455 [Sphingomonas sp.]|jgi:hypothetical protein